MLTVKPLTSKRRSTDSDSAPSKKLKTDCKYGMKCFRRNVVHLKEFRHSHLDNLLLSQIGSDGLRLPEDLNLDRTLVKDQLRIMMENNIMPETKQKIKTVSSPNKSSKGRPRSPTPSRSVRNKIVTETITKNDLDPKIISQSAHAARKTTPNGSLRVSSAACSNSHEKPSAPIKNTTNKQSQVTKTTDNYVSNNENEETVISEFNNMAKLEGSTSLQSLVSSINSEMEQGSLQPLKSEKRKVDLIFKTTTSCSSANSKFHPIEINERPICQPTSSYFNEPRRVLEKIDIHDYCPVVAPRGEFAAKHSKAAPYFLFYTTVSSSPDTHYDPLSVTFQELLDPSLGALESSLQINFMIDLAWLLAQYSFADLRKKPLTILYGEQDDDLKNITSRAPHIQTHHVKMNDAFGKHHTKMSILNYEDGSMRIVVSTANLYEPDWDNRTQGLWISPACPPLAGTVINTDEGESPTGFKNDLLRYLASYGIPVLQSWIERVLKTDFSQINVFLIASVPGMHRGSEFERYGHKKLSQVLSKHCKIPQSYSNPSHWSIITQCSSIGSLGPSPSSWFCGQFRTSLSRQTIKQLMSPPCMSVVYPTLENVRKSHDHLLGGGCLPYRKDQHTRQPWLEEYMCQWKAHSVNRNKAMPHIKTYCRISPDITRMAWFLLTSANLSKAAWGYVPQSQVDIRFNIKSYEVGVLFMPEFVVMEEAFNIQTKYSEPDPNINYFPFPFDLPLTQYGKNDGPFFMDYLK